MHIKVLFAVVSDYKYYELEDLFEIARERGEDPFFIILDEITDPTILVQ